MVAIIGLRPAPGNRRRALGVTTGPLSDVTVLDASRVLSGPFCTMLLRDLGAEVVKIESPGRGDMARRMGPLAGDDSAYFMSVNRGKQSVSLDIFTIIRYNLIL